jgi:PAS domain S-box-containing protein
LAARVTRPSSTALAALLVGVSYYLGSKVGFAIRFPSIPTSIVWPPNSILMAALMLTPPRRWWVYLLAALPAHILIQSQTAVPPPTMLFLFVTNAGEAVLGAWAVRRLCGGPPRFGYVRDVVVFFLFAVFAAPFVTSFPDAAAVVLTKWADDFSLVWQVRFRSNVLTVLTLVPAIVMWATNGRNWLRGVTLGRFTEGCLLALGLWVAYAFAYSQSSFGQSFAPALLYAPLPFLIWAALRFGAGGVSTSLLAVLLISALYAIVGRGPFTSHAPAEDVIGLQLFLIAISVPMMMLAAVTKERRRAAEALKESEARNRAILQAIPDLMFLQTREGTFLDYHAKDRADLYVPPEDFIGKNVRDVLPPELAENLINCFRLAFESGEPQVIEYALTNDGQERWYDGRIVRSDENVLSIVRDISERKRAEQALVESEKRFRMMADATPIMVWMSGPDKLCTYFNKGWLDFTGRTMGQEIGNGWAEGVHPEELDHCLRIYTTSFYAHLPFTIEYRLRRHDGEYRWVLDRGVPYYSPSGSFLGYIGSCFDITERKWTEEALRVSEEKYRTLFTSIDQGFCVVELICDGEGRVVDWVYQVTNPAFERQIGWRDAVGKRLREMMPNLEEFWLERFDRVAATGEAERIIEYSAVMDSWFDVYAFRVGQPSSRLMGMIFSNVTERIRAEEARRRGEAVLAQAGRMANLGAWEVDLSRSAEINENPLVWSDQVYRIYGYEPGSVEVTSGLFFRHAHPDDRQRIDTAIHAAVAERKPYELEHRIITADGAERVVHEYALIDLDEAGRPRRIIGAVQDITERTRAEQSLEQLTGRLLHLQDEERRRIARELHDTTAQNLLAIVINLETLVQKSSTLPQDFVDAIAECQSLCEQTQAEIRTLSYLLHPPMLDEAGLILALEWFIDGFSRRSSIRVDFVAPPDFRRLPSQMETALFRVVQESLTNIYRHSGSATAEIRLERDKSQVRLRVEDRGRGIDARGNGGGRAKQTGSLGVGISGMRERLRQLGGRLEVRSNEAGTSVTAVLPLEKGK